MKYNHLTPEESLSQTCKEHNITNKYSINQKLYHKICPLEEVLCSEKTLHQTCNTQMRGRISKPKISQELCCKSQQLEIAMSPTNPADQKYCKPQSESSNNEQSESNQARKQHQQQNNSKKKDTKPNGSNPGQQGAYPHCRQRHSTASRAKLQQIRKRRLAGLSCRRCAKPISWTEMRNGYARERFNQDGEAVPKTYNNGRNQVSFLTPSQTLFHSFSKVSKTVKEMQAQPPKCGKKYLAKHAPTHQPAARAAKAPAPTCSNAPKIQQPANGCGQQTIVSVDSSMWPRSGDIGVLWKKDHWRGDSGVTDATWKRAHRCRKIYGLSGKARGSWL